MKWLKQSQFTECKFNEIDKESKKINMYHFKSKIKQIASMDQGFYNGYYKMDLVTDQKNLTKNMICILKPRFLPSVFLKALPNEQSLVRFFGKNIEVNNRDIILVKEPVYKLNQQVYYFMEQLNKWVYGEILAINT